MAKTLSLSVGETRVEFAVPKSFKAYEKAAIEYRLTGASGNTGLEAVAFQDRERSKGKPLYDMTFPGDMKADVEYLGMMKPDATPEKPESEQLIHTTTIPGGERRWLLFRVRNAGDTIWDTEGCAFIFLVDIARSESGRWNYHILHDKYVYPGEHMEVWVPLDAKGGEQVELTFQFDWVGTFRERLPIWAAKARFTMADEDAPIRPTEHSLPITISTPLDIGFGLTESYEGTLNFAPVLYGPMPERLEFTRHEEFLSAYARPSEDCSGTMDLMVAPWTEEVTLKLITKDGIACKSIPIEAETEHLTLEANPDNKWTRQGDGRDRPVLAVKWMPFQVEWYLQPFLERRMKEDLAEFKSHGVSAVAIMEIPIALDEAAAERLKPLIQALREHEMPVMWWACYMFFHDLWEQVSGLDIDRGGRGEQDHEAELLDPNLPQAFVSMLDLYFEQYPETGYRTEDGRIPFVFDVPIGLQYFANKDRGRRFGRFLTDLDKRLFRLWLETRYIRIEFLNEKWSSSYAGFDEVVPEEYAEGTPFENIESPGMIDWDDFCSEMFTRQFGKIADAIHKKYPKVMVGYLGEEGTRWGVELLDTPRAEEVRRGMRCEAFQTDDLVARSRCDFVGQYTGTQYPEEFSASCVFLKKHGIDQFYILRPMHSGGGLPPLFPCWKAQWESGGPALVYGLDPGGIAHLTETQLKEMEFFTSLIPE